MARTNQRFMCNEESGATHCIGCNNHSCCKDLKTHREAKSSQMDKIVGEYNRLQKMVSSNQNNSLLEQIDEWEKSTITKVNQVAAQARQQAIELLSSRKVKINNELRSFSQELAQLRASETYAEHDLRRLNQIIGQFEEDFKRSNQMTNRLLHTERSDKIDWKGLIYVGEKQIINHDSRPDTVTGKSMSIIYRKSLSRIFDKLYDTAS